MPVSTSAPLSVLLLAHTHWDREWYRPASQFRQRLVALVEALLRDGTAPARPFLLDGQAVVLEDVLTLRPELREPLAQALRTGAIEAGPWYVLADELIPSGEALVRNLLAGRRVLATFGASAPPVCYVPDAFGHTAALPALAAGFGLTASVLWRGYGGARWPEGDTVRWRAPNGDGLLVWHLPPDGYEYGSALPTTRDAAAARWLAIASQVAPRARTGVILLTNGADHHARQEGLDHAVDALAAAAALQGHTVQRGSLRDWAARFAASARAQALPEVRGELRDSYGYTWTLQGTFATRAHQKRAVARADRLLRADVEPWLALAVLRERDASRSTAVPGLRALLERSWRTFLRTLPHDTLCGCSIDAVARALDHRLDVVQQEAHAMRETALDLLVGHDRVQARARTREQWVPHLVLRNRVARDRSGIAEVELVRTLRDVAVGPGSAPDRERTDSSDARTLRPVGLAWQPVHVRRRDERRESPQHYPDNDLVEVTRALVWVPDAQAVSGHGLRTIPLQHDVRADASAHGDVPAVRLRRRGTTATLENDALRLRIAPDGITLHDRARHARLDDLVHVTWQADHGDTYTAAPRGALRRLRAVRARVVARGPLRAAVTVTYARRVSVRSAPDERLDATPTAPTGTRRLIVHITYTLDAGAQHVGLRVHGVDRAGDHRLRVSIATGVRDARITADAAMWPVERVPLHVSEHEQRGERVTRAAPLHRWVAAHATARSFTIVSDGLAEYEPVDTDRVAVTLVRATDELSRASLPERPGHAGWPARVPAAQGPGSFSARLAVAPGGVFDAAKAHALADEVLLPLLGTTWRDATPAAPAIVAGIAFEAPRGVVSLAVKPADDGDGVVLRCVNLDAARRRVRWCIPVAGGRVEIVRLDETSADRDHVSASIATRHSSTRTVVTCTLAPYALLTLRVR